MMAEISPDFTLEDIRKIRDEFYELHKDLDFKAMADEINRNAAPVFAEIRRRRDEKRAKGEKHEIR